MKKYKDIVLPERTTRDIRIMARTYMIPRGSIARSVHIERIVELKVLQANIESQRPKTDKNCVNEDDLRRVYGNRKKR